MNIFARSIENIRKKNMAILYPCFFTQSVFDSCIQIWRSLAISEKRPNGRSKNMGLHTKHIDVYEFMSIEKNNFVARMKAMLPVNGHQKVGIKKQAKSHSGSGNGA